LVRLIVQPFSGSTRLYNAYSARPALQISPPLFLAISILLGTTLRGNFIGVAQTRLPGFDDLAVFIASGSPSGGFVKMLAATVFATVLIDLMLKLIGIVRLNKRRIVRFVATLEYEAGLLVIWTAVFFSFINETYSYGIFLGLLLYVPMLPATAIF
jgi:hypothetical protein